MTGWHVALYGHQGFRKDRASKCQGEAQNTMKPVSLLVLGLSLSALIPATAHAWGQRGHAAVGILAVEQLSDATRATLAGLLGSTDTDDVAGACTWPDTWRDMGDGADTAPWHYVNIDPEAKAYSARRDCPDGRCVTAQVNAQAARLGDPALPREERRLAFKFLCHLVGDLHQPLHVGYADDKGGNLVTIRYRGVSMNLHWYWDNGLLEQRVGSMKELVELLRQRHDQPTRGWVPGDTYSWTNESFALTRNFGYPPTRTVDESWETRSWQVTQQQLDVASGRLAAILEAVLGELGELGSEEDWGQSKGSE